MSQFVFVYAAMCVALGYLIRSLVQDYRDAAAFDNWNQNDDTGKRHK